VKNTGKSGQKTTVAHFMPWTGIGGVEIATLRLMLATSARFRHVAFCLPDAPAVKDMFEEAGIETVAYTPPEPSLRHGLRYINASRVVARSIRQAGADIVHFSEEKAAYHCSLAASLARTCIVCHLRVSNPNLDLRQRLCLMPVQSFIFVSKEAMQTFSIPLPANKARVIYDAIEIPPTDMAESNAAVRRELGIPDGSPIVGTLARVSPQKDYFTLASAAVEILARFPDTKFLVVGDNSLVEMNRIHYAQVKARLHELGIANSFIFTGHRTDVARLVAVMDISVLCTHREGFPLSILESMAMRKPVIATAVGGIPEIVIPGVTGFLHQHENSKELAAAIIALLSDPEKTKRIGLTAFEHVRENYSRQKFTDEVTRAYVDLMQR